MDNPIAYFITFTTYGTWLRGDHRGSVDKRHNKVKSDFIVPNSMLEKNETALLKETPFEMNKQERSVVLSALLEVCQYRSWLGYGVHVRSNHVHSVIGAGDSPEKVMHDFKSYATRAIKRDVGKHSKRNVFWTKHGSTKYIWNQEELSSIRNYVKYEQGKIMEYGSVGI